MNPQLFSEWLAPIPVSGKIRALARIYSCLTVNARELFVPEWTAGKEQRVLEILHGLNEIHHTLANQIVAYATNENEARPVHVLGQMLLEIENQYRLGNFVTPAIEFAQTRTPP